MSASNHQASNHGENTSMAVLDSFPAQKDEAPLFERIHERQEVVMESDFQEHEMLQANLERKSDNKFRDSKLSSAEEFLSSEQQNFRINSETKFKSLPEMWRENCKSKANFEAGSDCENENLEFLKSLSTQDVDHLVEIFIQVAKEEEFKLRKTNRKLLRELLYFRNEVNRILYEVGSKLTNDSKCSFDSVTFASNEEFQADHDIMFDDNFQNYDRLLQKRQPILHQFIDKVTQPNQLCQLLQDLKGLKESIDMARSLLALKFFELNIGRNDSSIDNREKIDAANSQDPITEIEDEKFLPKIPSTNLIEIQDRVDFLTSIVDESSNSFTPGTLGGRMSSESWMTVETVDLSSDYEKIYSILDDNNCGASWSSETCNEEKKNEVSTNSECPPSDTEAGTNAHFVENCSSQCEQIKDSTKGTEKMMISSIPVYTETSLRSVICRLFKILLQTDYFHNPGFVNSVDDGNSYKVEENALERAILRISSPPKICSVEDSFKFLASVQNKETSPLKADFSSNYQSFQPVKPEKQQKPIQVLRPTRLHQRSIPHYSSLWLTSIARLSLENFLRSGSIPVVQAASPKVPSVPQKIRIKTKNSGSQMATQLKLSPAQSSQGNILNPIQRASRLNLLRANDPTLKISTRPPLLRGIDLEKCCSRPCRLLLVNQCTHLPDPSSMETSTSLLAFSSLRWIIKWQKRPFRLQQTNDKSFNSTAILQIPQDQDQDQECSSSKEDRKPNACPKMQFRMVEVEIRDLTEDSNSFVDRAPSVTSGKQSVVMKPLDPGDIFSSSLTQSGNIFALPSNHATYHPSRTGKIPLKQQRRRHIFRNI